MKNALMIVPVALLLAGAAQAGTYAILQASDCPLVTSGELAQAVRKVGTVNGLNLPKDMTVRAELQCVADAKLRGRFVYTFRAAIEKQLGDGEMQRWAPVAQLTGYGTTSGSTSLLRDVSFTVRDLIRQEP
ncbi:MAG: hypothetical protein JWP41_4676 [Ramlibacter sp.]|nr:hypothetical protein [Ramlibacter sp.]